MLFVLSTGRSGSRTISNVLSQSHDMVCTHEPLPRLIEECARYRYGDFDAEELADLLRESRPAEIDGRRYGESANRLSPAAPLLAATFPQAQFLWLVRDGREFVASGMQRGWYADAKDTLWERWRLRGDRLGEVSEAEWEAWSAFERVCWLWRRTNEMIRDDLAALDDGRSRLVRLEDLENDMDDIAEFLKIEKVDWAVDRLNARSSEGRVGEPEVNRVDQRVGPAEWSSDERDTFDRVCGPLMDEVYPGWRKPAETVPDETVSDETVPDETVSDETVSAMKAVAAELAELRVLRGEMNLLVDQVHRVDRRSRDSLAARDREVAARKKAETARDRVQAEREADQQKLAAARREIESWMAKADQRSVETDEVKARLKKAENVIADIRASESFRLGHAATQAVNAPKEALRGLSGKTRRRARKSLRAAVKSAAAQPAAARLADRLPGSMVDRLVDFAVSSSTTKKPAAKSGSRKKPPIVVQRLGLRAVVEADVDVGRWAPGLDTSPATPEAATLTHVDLLLCGHEPSAESMAAIVDTFDPVVVRAADLLPPLPPGITPLGFTSTEDGELLSLTTGPGAPTAPDIGLPGRVPEVRAARDLPSPLTSPHEFRVELQTHLALVDDASLHDDPHQRASLLLCASATGLPLFVRDTAGLVGLVADEVLRAWSDFDPRQLTHDDGRRYLSWQQRSLVHRHHSARSVFDSLLVASGRPGLPTPSMSVVVASNRPDLAAHWSRQLGAQDHPEFEVIWAQHGEGFDPSHLAQARQHLGDRLQAVGVPADHTLGDALNAATARASGDVIVKWDDDDLYHPGHLTDLATARFYTGAELVGKAAEFVYLGDLDVTIRRFANSTEAYSTTIGGPALSIGRGDLRDLGGWRRTRRRVDALLIEDVRAAGGATYRTSGFGFVMMRTGSAGHAHTWSAGDEYFLKSAVDQRRGLDLGFAGIEVPVPASSGTR